VIVECMLTIAHIRLVQTPGMTVPPPAKGVRFQEPASNPGLRNTSQCEFLYILSRRSHIDNLIVPSTHDIYNWANNVKAKAPCFIRDVLAMKEFITEG
jgi:hypothetical protein